MRSAFVALLTIAVGTSCKVNVNNQGGSSSPSSSSSSSGSSDSEQELTRFEGLLEETCGHDIEVVLEPSNAIDRDNMARWCSDALAGANSGTKCETTADDHCQKAGVCGDAHGRAAFARLSRIVCSHDPAAEGVEPVLAVVEKDLQIKFPTNSSSIYSSVHDYTNRKIPAAANPNVDGAVDLSEKRSWAFAIKKLEKFKKLTEESCGRKLNVNIDYDAFREAGHGLSSVGWGCLAIVSGTKWVCNSPKRDAFNKRVKTIGCVPKPGTAKDPHLVSFNLDNGLLEASYGKTGTNFETDTNEWLGRNL